MTAKTPVALDSREIEVNLLIKGSEHCLDQCEALLNMIFAEAYVEQTQDSASIGTHMRHLLDRFQCLFNGLPDRTVDYDARKRDKSIETNMAAARFAAVTLKRRLSDLRRQEKQGVGQRVELGVELSVRESVHHASPQISGSSNVQRELMGMITHGTHHLALMVMIGKQLGYEFHKDLGKAPSTIIHERG